MTKTAIEAEGAPLAMEAQEHEDPILKAILCAQGAVDRKADRIKVLDLRGHSDLTDFFVVCSAQSDRQVKAIADSIASLMKGEEFALIAIEGYQDGRWVLMDYGDVIVHIFLDAIRDYYGIEHLWANAQVVPLPKELFASTASHLN